MQSDGFYRKQVILSNENVIVDYGEIPNILVLRS